MKSIQFFSESYNQVKQKFCDAFNQEIRKGDLLKSISSLESELEILGTWLYPIAENCKKRRIKSGEYVVCIGFDDTSIHILTQHGVFKSLEHMYVVVDNDTA